jgi:Papain-like cysteine protease AvrRpt2
LRIEYIVTLGKNGPSVVHRVLDDHSDNGGGGGGEGPDPGGGGGGEGPDPGGSGALGCGCPSMIVMGPTVITGCGAGSGLGNNGLNFNRRPVQKTHIIPGEHPPGTIAGTAGVVAKLGLEYQQQGFWCWAAVGSAVRTLFNAAKILSQCQVANAVLETERDGTPENECCAHPAQANVPQSMRLTLVTLGHREKADLGGVAAFNLVQEVVAAGEPLVARLAWDTDNDGYEEGGHFVLIAGWKIDAGKQYLRILDPDGGGAAGQAALRDVLYETFQNAYEGSGKWVATYFLKGMAA